MNDEAAAKPKPSAPPLSGLRPFSEPHTDEISTARNLPIQGPPPISTHYAPQSNPSQGEAAGVAKEHSGRQGALRQIGSFVAAVCEWIFGLISLVVGLSILAAIPILQFFSLGHLLEVSGRVARTGKLGAGFYGVIPAAQLGGTSLGIALVWLPLSFIASAWHSSQLISAGSEISRRLGFLLVASVCLMAVHVFWALMRGGKLRHFLWPAPLRFLRRLRQGGMYREARDRLWNFAVSLRLGYYFRLGFGGFFGALAWLILPVLGLVAAAAINHPIGILLGLPAGFALALVLLYLPFLQTHFAITGRFSSMFALGQVRLMFRYAPFMWWLALFLSLLLAFPLFLTKVARLPPELAWLPNLVCVSFILPGRLFSGWTMARARQALYPRFFLWRWLARLGSLPVAVVYVFLIYFTQYVCYNGWRNLLLQNTFLPPIPFLGM